MTREEAQKILAEYVKACREDDMLTLEQFVYEEVIEAMSMGAEALSVCPVYSNLEDASEKEYPCDKSWMTDSMLDMNAHCQVAFWKGAKWDREQMMKDAVETVVSLEAGGFPFIEYGVGELGLKVGDKVKLIIVKKDSYE